jgi:tyrosinase
MNPSRRNVVVQGCVIGAGIIASSVSGVAALAQMPQRPIRRSLQGLSWNDPIVTTYRDAVGLMKQMPDSQKFSWVNLARIHGRDPDNYHFCPHGNWYFLPWHRAYILTYERIIRFLTKNDDFALPYWDWTDDPTMPEVFLEAKTPDGKTNWLYVSDSGFTRTWPPKKPMPAEIVGPDVLKEILHSETYEEFGTSRPAGQKSLDQSWIVDQNSGVQGILEARAHNLVHNNIGGWMPSAMSPRDAIFFMHHANLDRIWALWNSLGGPNSSDPLWTDMQIKNNFYNVDGTFFSPKVSDLFDIDALGYSYHQPSSLRTNSSPVVLGLQSTLRALYIGASISNTTGVKSFVRNNTQNLIARTTKYLELPVTVDADLVTSVARRRPIDSGADLLDFRMAQDQRASGPRVYGFIRDVEVTEAQSTMYRVFIDCSYLRQL